MAKRLSSVEARQPLAYATNNLTGRQLAAFTALVALFGILADAALGHGLTWENDPYWTYWITKTFLIAFVFGVGTALVGIGRLRGALVTLVHTLVLTIYYWTLSPIGLPSSPHWLDLEHTWLTGLPIHFGVIYLGYLAALWVWRNRLAVLDVEPAKSLALRSLAAGALIVVLAGALANLVLGEFSGVTWYVVRLLITVPFLIVWWAAVGRGVRGAVVGGIILALVWATYAQYLGPNGLPDTPLRIFDTAAPPATAHWLTYNQIWLASLPIYLAVMIGALALAGLPRKRLSGPIALALAAVATAMAVATIIPEDSPKKADVRASGDVFVETGAFYSDQFVGGKGNIAVSAVDSGDRASPLPPHDQLAIMAEITTSAHVYSVIVNQPMVAHPMGLHTTWWGVGYEVDHHGRSGIGTDKLPNIKSKLAVFGLGEVTVDGKIVAVGVPVHVMTAEQGFPKGARLEMDVGSEHMTPLPGVPDGHLRVLWSDFEEDVPGESLEHYLGGNLVLWGLIAAGLAITRPPDLVGVTVSSRRPKIHKATK